jgi:hypothetical protein
VEPKYLFILGIVALHGVMAQAFFVVDPGPIRASWACNRLEGPLPDFTPPRLIMAARTDWLAASIVDPVASSIADPLAR